MLDIQIGINGQVCNNANETNIPLLGNNLPTDPNNVVWFGPGVNAPLVTDDGITATFASQGLAPGFYTICADVTDDGACFEAITVCEEFEIVAEIIVPSPVELFISCDDANSGTVSLSQLFPGINNEFLQMATYTTPTGSVVGGALIYDSPGCHVITIDLNTGTPCNQMINVTSSVFVTEKPEPEFTMNSAACYSSGSSPLTVTPQIFSPTYVSPITRVWTISGDDITSGTFSMTDGSFTVNGVGTMNVTLSEKLTTPSGTCTNNQDCIETYTQTIVVEDGTSLDPTFTASSTTICINENVTLTATETGGIFTGNGIDPTDNGTDNGGDGTAMFSNSIPGIYQVDYTLSTPNGCSNVYSLNIEILDIVNGDINDLTICSEENAFLDLNTLFTSATTSGGTFTLTASDAPGVVVGFNLNYTGAGTYTIRYDVGDIASCNGNCTDDSDDDCFARQTAIVTVGAPCGTDLDNSNDCVIYEEQFNNEQLYIAGNCTGPDVTTCATYNDSPAPSTLVLASMPAVAGANSDFSEATGADDFITVSGGQMSINSINSVVCLESSVADISGAILGAQFSIDLSQTSGGLEPDDYIAVYQIVDGGTPALVSQINDDISGIQTISASGIIGNTLQIQVCLKNGDTSGGDAGPVEEYSIDNLIVAGAPDATINDIQLDCQVTPTGTFDLTSLFDMTTSNGGDFFFTSDGSTSAGTTTTGAIISESTLVFNDPGCYHILYEVQCAGNNSFDDAYVLITEQPQPNFNIQNQVCFSAGDPILDQQYTPQNNSPSYGETPITTWSVSGPATILDAMTGEIQITGAGEVILTLTEDLNYDACGSFPAGLCSESFSISINVEDGTALDATFTASDNPICVSDIINLTPITSGGVFTGDGVTDNGLGTGATFTAVNPGIYQVDYTLNSSNGCSNFYSLNIEVLENISAPFFGSDNSICLCPGQLLDAESYLLSSAPIGGTFSIVSGGAFANLLANTSILTYTEGCGDLTLRYTVNNCDESNVMDDIVISIRECSTADFDAPSSFCQADEEFILGSNLVNLTGCTDNILSFETIAGPDGNDLIGGSIINSTIGTFSSLTINPEVSAGEYILQLTVSDPAGICSDVVLSQNIIVSSSPALTTQISPIADLCENATFPITLSLINAIDLAGDALNEENGYWYGSGVSNIAGTNGSFTPNDTDGDGIPGPGSFTVCVDIQDGLCSTTYCSDILIQDEPAIPTPSDLELSCFNSLPTLIGLNSVFPNSTDGGTYTLGIASDAGATIDGGFLNIQNDGCYVLCYEFSASTCSAVAPVCANISVSSLPDVFFDIPETVCWDGVAGSLTVSPILLDNPSVTREWSIGTEQTTTTTSTIDINNGDITINDSGIMQICLEETKAYDACGSISAGSCSSTFCQFITITNSSNLDPSWSLDSPYCEDDNTDIDLNILISGDQGGVFTGPGVTGTHPDYFFNPNTAGPGIQTICYSLNDDSGCSATNCVSIEVFGAVDATVNDIVLDCDVSSAGQISLSGLLANNTTSGGTFSIASNTTLTEPWINELEYDDPGADDEEFLEIAGPAGFDLSTCEIYLYNGGDQMIYHNEFLSGVITNEAGGIGTIVFNLGAAMQNSTEGIALVCGGVLLDFITYEGSFTAIGGPANGITGTNIGTDPATANVSLQNTGSSSTDPWIAAAPSSPNALNANVGQGFGSGSVDAIVIGGSVLQYNETGCVEITYTATAYEMASGSCIDTDNAFVQIPEQPNPSFTIQNYICLSAGDTSLTLNPIITSPTYLAIPTTTWSIDASGLINATASISTNGEVTIVPNSGNISGSVIVNFTEEIENEACGSNDAFTCSNTFSQIITIQDGTAQDACFTFSDDSPCINDNVTITANTNGGVFSGVGVVDDGNGMTATISISNCQPVAITYTLSTTSGCSNSCTINLIPDSSPPLISIPASVTSSPN